MITKGPLVFLDMVIHKGLLLNLVEVGSVFLCFDDVVFIRGVFYFLFEGGRLGSHDIATGKLKFDHSQQCTTQPKNIHIFFGLDGEIMVKYYDAKAHKICIRSYDWSNKVWVRKSILVL